MGGNLLAALPEQWTRFTQLPNELGHNAVWDFVKAPDGRFYVSVCGENEKPLTALLYEYDPATGGLRLIVDVAKAWIVDAEQMPPSKIHTSIDFLPDGRLIMATHNTAPAPGHRQWMFEQYYEHPWEGYPGSALLIVDPDSGAVEARGIPVPRESIYGGLLGNDSRYYYFLGYMRGHFYRLDLETNEVKDYGKVSEYSSCRLVKDSKGRIYGSAYTGGLWRYEPETDRVDGLKASFESPRGTRSRRQFIFALHTPQDTLLLVDNADSELIELHPDTLEIKRHGPIHLPEDRPANPYIIGGLAADSRFVLYYGLKTYEEAYCPVRLMRWDVLRGGAPENLGLVVPRGKDSQYICEMIFDGEGWLHMVDVCGEFSPYILAVDAGKLELPGADAPDAALRPYTEPDYNGVGKPAYMHIAAGHTDTLPLHQHLDWGDTAVCHMRILPLAANEAGAGLGAEAEAEANNGTDGGSGSLLYAISGNGRVLVLTIDQAGNAPVRIETVYTGGSPLSGLDINACEAAIATTDGRILLVDLPAGRCTANIRLPDEAGAATLQAALPGNQLLASTASGAVYAISLQDGIVERQEPISLAAADARLVALRDGRLLYSGGNGSLYVYERQAQQAYELEVKAPAIRGRAFDAVVTGGLALADGTIVAGTKDGMLFALSADLQRVTSYGRLYASGSLRGFIALSATEAAGIYGDARDAGHVFYFSLAHGLVDLGRPRVTKDNDDQRQLDTEWASIHHLSCLAYEAASDWLAVASAETFGCLIRYRGTVRPGMRKERGAHG